jgi:hypothetical protein
MRRRSVLGHKSTLSVGFPSGPGIGTFSSNHPIIVACPGAYGHILIDDRSGAYKYSPVALLNCKRYLPELESFRHLPKPLSDGSESQTENRPWGTYTRTWGIEKLEKVGRRDDSIPDIVKEICPLKADVANAFVLQILYGDLRLWDREGRIHDDMAVILRHVAYKRMKCWV